MMLGVLMTQQGNRRVASLIRPIAILLAALTVTPFAAPLASDDCSEAVKASLPASGCNRAFSLHVLDAELVDEWDARPAPPGRRWLVLEVRFDNWMPTDLVFGLGYQEAVLVASLHRQLYLVVNDRLVLRARVAEGAGLEDEFILPAAGTQQQGRVAFAVPDEEINSVSLRYYHDQYAPIRVSWLGKPASPDDARAQARYTEGHDLLRLGVQDYGLHDSWHDVRAPEGMQWLVVDLRGQGEWRTQADARALKAGAPLDEEVSLRRVMEYIEGFGLLQVVVDGRHGYVRETELSALEDDPALLPDAWAGGQAVFPVPDHAERIELVAYMPQFRGTDISSDIRPALRFVLREPDGEPVPAGAPAALVEDDPIRVTIHALRRVDTFAGHAAEGDERLVLIEASMSNLSAVGGMMAVTSRFKISAPDGELVAAYQRGPIELREPFWLPADDEPRHFLLLYRVAGSSDALELEYGGVSGTRMIDLRL